MNRLSFVLVAALALAAGDALAQSGAEEMSGPVLQENSTSLGSSGGAASESGTARARPASNRPARNPSEYAGVVPPRGGRIPGLRASSRRARRASTQAIVAWPGFQPTPSGSRIFLAVTAQPTVTPNPGPNVYRYRIANARIPVSNNRRVLDTAAFETPVARAYLRQERRDAELVIEMRGPGEPSLSQQAGQDGLFFVYLDFPRWSPPGGVQVGIGSSSARRPQINNSNAGGASSRGSGGSIDIRPAADPGPEPPPEGGSSSSGATRSGGAPVIDSEVAPPPRP